VLAAVKRDLGTMTFAAQYLQNPVAEGGNLIKWQWFRSHDAPPPINSTDRIVVSWDTALSAKELADFSACVVLQIRGESVFVLDVLRERLEYPDLKRKVIEVHNRWRYVANDYALLIENKGSGMSLVQDLRDQNIHAIAIDPVGDKVMRMNQQTARIETDRFLCLRRHLGSMNSVASSWHSQQVPTPTRSMPCRRRLTALSIAKVASILVDSCAAKSRLHGCCRTEQGRSRRRHSQGLVAMARDPFQRVRETRRERNEMVPTRPTRTRPPPIRNDYGSCQRRGRRSNAPCLF
jgi:predicted phage terminase large subunit-like protein